MGVNVGCNLFRLSIFFPWHAKDVLVRFQLHFVRTVISFSPCVEIVRARAIWEEVVKGIGSSATALMERIDDLCDPERIEDANMLEEMREKYRNEITVRTKSSWWRKLLQVSG